MTASTGKNKCKNLLYVLPVNLCFTLTLLFFSPMEVFMGNRVEFSFRYGDCWPRLLLFAFAAFFLGTALELLLFRRFLPAVNALIFTGTLAFYLQSLVLNGAIGDFTGDNPVYEKSLKLTNLLVWAAIFLLVLGCFAVLKKKKISGFNGGAAFAAGALILMQTAGFFSMALQMPSSEPMKDNYLTEEGSLTVSAGDNVILFVVDTCDEAYVDEAMKTYGSMLDGFEGFTLYANHTSVFSRTFPSLPYLLTGEYFWFDEPMEDYIHKAYTASSFLPEIAKKAEIRIFTDDPYVDWSVRPIVANSRATEEGASLSTVQLLRCMLKVSFYRGMPYALKERFWYTSYQLNQRIMQYADAQRSFDDAYFRQRIEEEGLSLQESGKDGFRLYHLMGPHYGCHLDETGHDTAEMDPVKATCGSFRIIAAYLEEMKRLGVYDNATIILTADHGKAYANVETMELDEAQPCLLMVKQKGAARTSLRISRAPVSHTDLAPTILKGLGLPHAERAVDEIGENEERSRLYYFTTFISDIDGEIALREYRVDGDAADYANWTLTGNDRDILYSERAVSRHRLSEFIK